MSFFKQRYAVFGLAFLAAVCGVRSAAAQQWTAPVFPTPTPAGQKIEAALDQPVDFEFVQTPLADVVAFLAMKTGVSIELDTPSLGAVGMDSSSPITRSMKGVSLRSALKAILNDFGLTFVVTHDVLLITTPEHVQAMVELRVYDVALLLGAGDTAETLGRMLSDMFTTRPAASLEDVYVTPEEELAQKNQRPKRVITAYGNLLLVRDNPTGQAEIAGALNAIGQAMANAAAEAATMLPETPAPATEQPETPPAGSNEAPPEKKP